MNEAWATDEEIQAARVRFEKSIPGYRPPVAFSIARRDPSGLVYGYINKPDAIHRLPAAVLAGVSGYVASTQTFTLSREEFELAVQHLSPASAAIHMDHPNLWSWRELLRGGDVESVFVALFVTHVNDPVVDGDDALFRRLIER